MSVVPICRECEDVIPAGTLCDECAEERDSRINDEPARDEQPPA